MFPDVVSSLANQVGGVIGNWVKNPFNRLFFYWYFLPALAFILFQRFVVLPTAFDIQPPNLLAYAAASPALSQPADSAPEGEPSSAPTLPDSSLDPSTHFTALLINFLGVDMLYFIILPFVAAIGLNAIAFQITRLYEGYAWPVSVLLKPLKARNTAESKKLYGDLPKKRLAYLTLWRTEKRLAADDSKLPEVRQKLADLRRDIQKMHDDLESKAAGKPTALPSELHRVTPTALGNMLAVAEEYPVTRYGIDSVLFWPRLRSELKPEELLPLDSAKGVVDGMLNFSLLAYLAAVESIIVGIVVAIGRAPVKPESQPLAILFGCAVLALVVGYAAYRGAVNAAQSMGASMQNYFDYNRDAVLAKFGLKRPDQIEDEKIVWYRLGAFLRRGESFYFPEFAEAEKENKV
ncbi:MAG: hypothetical protein FJ030_11445 [Chloroflexi bacterium]|nr:hypothetical protein [Chloroflexota bacterium]